MNELVCKVASRGEGKTKWLLNAAKRYSDSHAVYLVQDDLTEYSRFCEKYFITFNELCKVQRYTGAVEPNSVILIDDLFSQSIDFSDVAYLKRDCHKVFITINGVTVDNDSVVDSTQLTINDVEG